jgi:hypothetical protein
MIAQYKNASSYQDTGLTKVIQARPAIAGRIENASFQASASSGDLLVTFKTYYVRPNIFRFDWISARTTHSREASVWSDGKKLYSWMPSLSHEDDEFTFFTPSIKYLALAIDDATASSTGAAYPLISMLVGESSSMSFEELLRTSEGFTLVGEELIDGEICYVIKANLSGVPWTIWIDKQRHLLRKTRTVYGSGSFNERVENEVRKEFIAEEIHRDIRINEPIARDVFSYRPKLESRDIDLTRTKRRPTDPTKTLRP